MEGLGYQYFWRLFGFDPFWLTQIGASLVLAYTCCVFGVVFGKMGRSPFLGFIFLLPYVLCIIPLWALAVRVWPQEKVRPPV
jgi:hypothetical protein